MIIHKVLRIFDQLSFLLNLLLQVCDQMLGIDVTMF